MKKLTNFRRWMMKIQYAIIPDGPAGDAKRGALWQPYLKACGENFKMAMGAYIFNPAGLEVGDNVYIGFHSYLGQGDIILGDEVLIGNHVSITASNHLAKNGSYRFGGFKAEQVKVGQGTWIGAHASITAGVSIGQGNLIAAGCVVTKSIFEDGVIIGGIPGKIIKKGTE